MGRACRALQRRYNSRMATWSPLIWDMEYDLAGALCFRDTHSLRTAGGPQGLSPVTHSAHRAGGAVSTPSPATTEQRGGGAGAPLPRGSRDARGFLGTLPPPPSHEHMTPEKYPLQECSLLPSNYLTDKFTSVSRERQAGCRILPVTGKAGEIKGSADGRATETGRGQGTRRP